MVGLVDRAIVTQRRGQLRQAQRGSLTPAVSLPSPIGGLNTRDALDAMSPTDALQMLDWMPGEGSVDVRPGNATYATGVGVGMGGVKTTSEYNAAGVRKLLAAGGGSIYDASAPGAVGGALLAGQTEDAWVTTQIGDDQIWVNGADAEQSYDGTVFGAITFTGTNRPTPGTVTVAHTHKRRVYYAVNAAGVGSGGSGDFYYTTVDGSFTACELFQLSWIVPRGGQVINITTVSRDAGQGTDDYIAFVLDSGEVVLYTGEHPADIGWAIETRVNIGGAFNPRMAAKIGADGIIGARDGYNSLTQALRTARPDPATMLSSKISPTVTDAMSANPAGFGWQIAHYPRRNWAIVNVPGAAGGAFTQHVLNLVTGAWGIWRLQAQCWSLFNDDMFFGAADGSVRAFDQGALDDDGALIEAVAQPAFTPLGDRSARKILQMLAPTLQTSAKWDMTIEISADFKRPLHQPSQIIGRGASGGKWDVGPWDAATWGLAADTIEPWYIQAASGHTFSMILTLKQRPSQIQSSLRWAGTIFALTSGGIL